MRPEPFSADDSDESRTVVQDAKSFYGSELEDDARPRSFMQSRRPPERSRDSSLPGSLIAGKYRIEQVVERTSHELVSIARHIDLGEPVVVRQLTDEGAASPEVVASFLRGARDALKLNGFHAERVSDLGRLESGAPYRVAALPRGPSLEEFVHVRGPLPSEDAVDLVLLACEGVAEAHALGLLHRNLSTSNIVLERHPDGAPLVKVRNFGLPDPLANDPELAGRFGRHFAGRSSNALRYASPEQIRQPDAVDERADVWALGAILYELIAGVPAYAARSSSALLAMIVADPPIALESHVDDIAPELESVVLSCLSKNPDGRPNGIEDLVQQLLPFASEQVDGVATRVQRVMTQGAARASYGAYPTRSPRRRTSVPALPARGSGPFYGSGTLPPLPKLPSFERDHARGRSMNGSRSPHSQRRAARASFDDGERSQDGAGKSALLMFLGAALGAALAFLVVSARLGGGGPATPTAAVTPRLPEPKAALAPSPISAPSAPARSVGAPVKSKPTALRRDERTEEPPLAERDEEAETPVAAAKTPVNDKVDEALFDKPE
jgi:serine/threonine protein kinase